MKLMVVAALFLVATLAACGGGDNGDRVLQLRMGDMTVDEFRTTMRTEMVKPLSEEFCAGLRGLNKEEVLAVIEAEQEEEREKGIATPTVQAPSKEDNLYAAQIVIDECQRAFD